MIDLYAILGVPRDADAAAIKTAHRRGAKQKHPDRGGSTEQMQELQAAYECLSDPARRAAYDATGEDAGGSAVEVDARAVLMSRFRENLTARNIPAVVSIGLSHDLHTLEASGPPALKKMHLLQRRLGRVRHVGDGDNLLSIVIQAQIESLRSGYAANRHAAEVSRRALDLLRHYTDDGDAPEENDVRLITNRPLVP